MFHYTLRRIEGLFRLVTVIALFVSVSPIWEMTLRTGRSVPEDLKE